MDQENKQYIYMHSYIELQLKLDSPIYLDCHPCPSMQTLRESRYLFLPRLQVINFT